MESTRDTKQNMGQKKTYASLQGKQLPQPCNLLSKVEKKKKKKKKEYDCPLC